MRRQDSYELMVGSRIDPQFRPVLCFGSGGTLGRVMKDYAQEGIDVIFGHILPENYGMQRVCKRLGFTVNYDRFEEVMKAEITL